VPTTATVTATAVAAATMAAAAMAATAPVAGVGRTGRGERKSCGAQSGSHKEGSHLLFLRSPQLPASRRGGDKMLSNTDSQLFQGANAVPQNSTGRPGLHPGAAGPDRYKLRVLLLAVSTKQSGRQSLSPQLNRW
jgi:hypothetical protein